MANPYLYLIVILVFTKTILLAQVKEELVNTRPLNSISINLLGDATLISINYEKQFIISQSLILSTNLGIGYDEFKLSFDPGYNCETDRNFTIPHHVTGNFGKGRHLLEIGIGGTIISGNTSRPYYLYYSIVGYRFLPFKSNQVNFRIFSHVPILDDNIFFPFGLSFGISF